MVYTANLGFPRIGPQRELKKAVEKYWKGEVDQSELEQLVAKLRQRHWRIQQSAGIDVIPSNDFSLYDHVLDTIAMLGCVPDRYQWSDKSIDLDLYFAMARGSQSQGRDVVAMEMTKWFDTNYHYIVPEFNKNTKFRLTSLKIVNEYLEAKSLGIETRPVMLGPVSFLLLGKCYDGNSPLAYLEKLLPVYVEVLGKLAQAGAEWVQLDEPCLSLDLDTTALEAFKATYKTLAENTKIKKMLTTYFAPLRTNLPTALSLAVDGMHFDFVRGAEDWQRVLTEFPKDKVLSLGLIDGRNIWKADLNRILGQIDQAVSSLGKAQILIAASCSLLHCPIDLNMEKKLDPEIKNWMSFAVQKLDELVILAKTINEGKSSQKTALLSNSKAMMARQQSSRIHNDQVKTRLSQLKPADSMRPHFAQRICAQEQVLHLPPLPTTTIGSFPQTQEIRQMRARYKNQAIDHCEYEEFLEQKTKDLIDWQEEIGIDVLVHGEYERNDMVEYFGEQLEGFVFTEQAWVQSYGSRCVKPPIIFGDVSRPQAMTVRWSSYAQSLTSKPVKGMLTGPITILQWSFVRDDQPREVTCRQIALAIRDEVRDLEQAGIKLIQIDEPAFREGLPLRNADRSEYLRWAVQSFRIASSGISDSTQIHTHMCYSEFNDIIESIADLDADVISIETSRSAMELLDAFVQFKYPNQIGPGVYDIHSPRVPKKSEMVNLMAKALQVLDPRQVWVNPDCGLKTRSWDEVSKSLKNMVDAARELRLNIESDLSLQMTGNRLSDHQNSESSLI